MNTPTDRHRPRRLATRVATLAMALLLAAVAYVSHQRWQRRFDGGFEDVTEAAGLTSDAHSMSVSWADWDGDGWPDLWIGVHYYEDDRPVLYRNLGDGSFRIVDGIYDHAPLRDTHGSAWADFDNDGDPDLLETVGRTAANLLHVNREGRLVDQAKRRGVNYPLNRGRMPAWIDWNRDGRLDLVLSCSLRDDGTFPPAIFLQRAHGGRFDDATDDAGFALERTGFMMQVADLTGDDVPELLVHGNPYPQKIYLGGTWPMRAMPKDRYPTRIRGIQDVAIADFDGDLDLDLVVARRRVASDLFIANDRQFVAMLWMGQNQEKIPTLTFRSTGRITIRQLKFLAQGQELEARLGAQNVPVPSPAFPLVASPDDEAVQGLPLPTTGGKGLLVGYRPEEERWTVMAQQPLRITNLIVESTEPIRDTRMTDYERPELRPMLWTNEDGHLESRLIPGASPRVPCTGAVPGDFDNDGDVDAYLACAGLLNDAPNVLIKNRGNGRFARVPRAGGALGDTSGTTFGALANAARVAAADYDRDGFLDLLVPGSSGIVSGSGHNLEIPRTPTRLFRNTGNHRHWLELDLVGAASNRDAIGASVVITAGGRSQLRHAGGGVHRYAQDHDALHVGLGRHTRVERLEIRWPSGRRQVIIDLPADRILRIREPGGTRRRR